MPATSSPVPTAERVATATEPEGAFRARLAERRADELQRGRRSWARIATICELAVRDLGARAFGSHGETWAAALCLRLGLASAVAEEMGEPPVLLVDDPFSALDPRRRDQIGERLATRGGQVVISVADEADVPGRRAQPCGTLPPASCRAQGRPDAALQGVRRAQGRRS